MQRTAVCLWLLLALGGICLLTAGATYPSILAYMQLDRMLTHEELYDDTKRQATLEFLTKANGNQWIFWLVVGIANISLSALGLWSLAKQDQP